MEAGLELDALIAEKVFGLVLRNTFTGEEKPMTAAQVLAEHSIKTSIPKFSTDIRAAWKVLEELKKKHWNVTLNCHHGEWAIWFDHGSEASAITAESAPLVICLAALELMK